MSVFDYPRINFTGTLTLDQASASRVDAEVVGVQAGPETLYTAADDAVALSQLVGRRLEFRGHVTAIGEAPDAPGAQFFIDELSWHHDSYFEISGTPSKATSQWHDRTRNVNLSGEGGASVYVHHVIEAERDGCVRLPGFEDDPDIVGAVLRYCVFACHASAQLEPGERRSLITGSFAPLRRGEDLRCGPVGRLLISAGANIPTPPGTVNNGAGALALAPAVARWRGGRLSLDALASFPEQFQGSDDAQWDGSEPAKHNAKFDLGPVSLLVRSGADERVVGAIDYRDLAACDRRGWVFDFDLSGDEAARRLLDQRDATVHLVSDDYGELLGEAEHQIVTNSPAIYGEQHGSRDQFVSQGYPPGPVEIRVLRRGRELSAADCPPVKVHGYRVPPGPDPETETETETDPPELLCDDFGPGRALELDVDAAGGRVLVFTIGDDAPPASYAALVAPGSVALVNAAMLSARILANDASLDRYWEDSPNGPVARDELGFALVHEHVLRSWQTSSAGLALDDEGAVACAARELLTYTDPRAWLSPRYMPASRDMSASQRTLLQAWCRRVLRDAGASRAISVYTVEFDVLDGHEPGADATLSARALSCQGWRSSGDRAGARLRNETDRTIRAMHLISNNSARRFSIDARSCGRLFSEVWVKADGSEAVFLGAELAPGAQCWMRVPPSSAYEIRCCDGHKKCPFSSQVFEDEAEARDRIGDGAGWLRHHHW